MAQLSQDCFASGATFLSVEDAVAAIVARFTPVEGTETVPLAEADGRVLAADLVASLKLPPFTNSAVDGYAVRGEDLPRTEAQPFRVAGRLQAGSRANVPPLASGEAVRIFTGAPLPEGADTVVIQEVVKKEGDRVIVPPGQKKAQNVRYAGEDLRIGVPVLTTGKLLMPADIGLIASLGLAEVQVKRRLRVAYQREVGVGVRI